MKISEEMATDAIREGGVAVAEKVETGEKKSAFVGFLRKPERGEEQKLIWVDPARIQPNPFQPRRDFDSDKLEALTESIRENGILQPLTVRKCHGQFELIAGERRLRAAKKLGLKQVPCVLGKYTDEQSSVLALVENIQRSELNFFEEADAIGRLLVCHELTQEEIAARLGKSQPAVANKLRLLRLPLPVRTRILENGLTERHARCLLRLPDEKNVNKALDSIVSRRLNVAESEKLIEKMLGDKVRPKRRHVAAVRDMRLFCNTLEKAVKSIKSTGLPVESRRSEHDGFVEYVITLPKNVEK